MWEAELLHRHLESVLAAQPQRPSGVNEIFFWVDSWSHLSILTCSASFWLEKSSETMSKRMWQANLLILSLHWNIWMLSNKTMIEMFQFASHALAQERFIPLPRRVDLKRYCVILQKLSYTLCQFEFLCIRYSFSRYFIRNTCSFSQNNNAFHITSECIT